jgi:RNA polymerase sigma-70 factor (ECF subfamily)
MRSESGIASTPNGDKTQGTIWPHHGNCDYQRRTRQSALPIAGNVDRTPGVESEKERDPAARADETTLAELYANYSPSIYSHCYRFLRSAAGARDATQETFVRVMSRGIVVTCEKAAIGYLYRTSTNVCLNILSKQKMENRTAAELAMNAPNVRWSAFADREFVLVLLARCGEDRAQVAIMHYVGGMSQIEIADLLGITRKTVFNRLRSMACIARDLLLDGGQDPQGHTRSSYGI